MGTALAPTIKVVEPDFKPLGVKNIIINGGMDVWQRGTSFTFTQTGSGFGADRWSQHNSHTAGNISFAQNTSGLPIPGENANYCLYVANGAGNNPSLAAGAYCTVMHKVEGYNLLPFVGKTVTLSFWALSLKTGTYTVSLRNVGADRAFLREYSLVAGVWKKIAVTFPLNYSGGTWNYTNGVGVYITFALAVGTTYQGTPNTWLSGNYFATSNQVNWLNETGNTFRLANVQLELGEQATEFERRSFETELDMCQRYYQKSYDYATAPQSSTYVGCCYMRASYSGSWHVWSDFKKRMRTVPGSYAIYSLITGNAGYVRDDSAATDRAVGLISVSESNYVFFVSGAVDGNAMGWHWTADAEL